MNCSTENELTCHTRIALYICGYVNITLCAIGMGFNVSVIMVYTQKHMISSMHTIIVHLAAVDAIAMIAYVPHSWQQLIRPNWYTTEEYRTQTWELISFYSWHVTAMFTHASTLLAVMLGIWRYIGIIHPLQERSWCNMKTTNCVIIVCYITSAIVSIPAYMISKVEERYDAEHQTKIYEVKIILENNSVTFKSIFILYGVVLKTLPSFVLIIISYKLIRALRKAKHHHEQLTRTTSTVCTGPYARNSKNNCHTAKITKMLLIVLIIFILEEFPHGIFCTLTAVKGFPFFYNYYQYLLEFFNTVKYGCTCLYFIVHYSMSRKFRNTFKTLIGCKQPSTTICTNTFASYNIQLTYQCRNFTFNSIPQCSNR